MNEKEFCFIMCTNNDALMEESIYYVNRLYVPAGYSLDLITVNDAPSISCGYNSAMRESRAKYKIYIHQDTFILNRDILHEMLEVFDDPSIGIMGLVGCVDFPPNAIQWYGVHRGAFINNDLLRTKAHIRNISDRKCDDVVSLDGFFLATQYDIPWREDLFKGWDFYDVSQSFEFRKQGYRVVIPHQDEPWALHYDGILNMKGYYSDRKVFTQAYAGELASLRNS